VSIVVSLKGSVLDNKRMNIYAERATGIESNNRTTLERYEIEDDGSSCTVRTSTSSPRSEMQKIAAQQRHAARRGDVYSNESSQKWFPAQDLDP
jgi:hypothetical protein